MTPLPAGPPCGALSINPAGPPFPFFFPKENPPPYIQTIIGAPLAVAFDAPFRIPAAEENIVSGTITSRKRQSSRSSGSGSGISDELHSAVDLIFPLSCASPQRYHTGYA